jgi:hypothetical protein
MGNPSRRSIATRLGVALLMGASGGCGGSAFETADAGAEAAATSDAAPAGDAANGATDATADAPGVCGPLPAGAKDVYVDGRFTGTPQTGVAACPLSTILKGVAAATLLGGAVTVHVAGATPALVYAETGPVTVGASVTLKGDGPARTTISASGACATTTCAVLVSGGGALDGFTVVSTGGDGIVTAAMAPAPVVKNVAANGSKGNGIVALGAAELGPGVAASNNGAGGLQSPLAASGRLHVIGTSNAFDGNGGNGVNVDGAATLSFEGGTASGNFQGIRLAGATAASGGGHTITSLVASNNKGPGGVVAYGGQTIKMRSSSLVGNANVGLLYNYVNGSTLDLGAGAADPGNNTFGSATAASRNGKVGLRLCGAGAAGTQPAYADLWSSCPPTQTLVACDTVVSTYTDIAYAPAVSAVGPVVATPCALGP